jgi:hypothetical protein
MHCRRTSWLRRLRQSGRVCGAWTHTIRRKRPRAERFSGKWTFRVLWRIAMSRRPRDSMSNRRRRVRVGLGASQQGASRIVHSGRTFLYANDDLDAGRECRRYLEQILFRNTPHTHTRAVTPADLKLQSSCWRAPQHDAAHQATVYRFEVVIDAPDEILTRIHRFEYQLPPVDQADSGRKEVRTIQPGGGRVPPSHERFQEYS